jgi:RimJ/RimL family protein N-acetyltransferase
MSNITVLISVPAWPDLRLRSIRHDDLENLRNWKNSNKHSFFLNEDITPEQQQKWYSNFTQREHDHMFIVEQLAGEEWQAIGCMGFRRLDDEGCVDAYNIIRANKIEPATFTMSEAFKTMLAYAASVYPGLPLQVKVLSHNPAVEWYKKNHFSIIQTVNNYYLMELNKDSLENITWSVNQYS